MNNIENRIFIFLSELLKRKIFSSEGKFVGKLLDLKVGLDEIFPKVTSVCIKVRGNKGAFSLNWDLVDSIENGRITLKPQAEGMLGPLEVKEREILLKDEILDKQVVDTFGVRIERANDLHLLINKNELRLVHVDFGIRGILRRLGWLELIDAITDWFFSYKIKQKLLSWKYIQPLSSHPQKQALKLNTTHRNLSALHPSDLADLLEDLNKEERAAVFKSLDLETAAETLQEVEPKLQKILIETHSDDKASDILEEMSPDEAADLLSGLSLEKQKAIIQAMEIKKRKEMEELLTYPEGTAGSIMTLDFIALNENEKVEEALKMFKHSDFHTESSSYIYVIDDQGTLKGVITLRNLVISPPLTLLHDVMNRRIIKAKLEDDVKEVAEKFKKYNLLILPVVDKDKKLKGVITIRDAIESIFPEFED